MGLSMLFKLNFGIVAVAMLASFTSKLKVIADQKGPERIYYYSVGLRAALGVFVVVTMAFVGWQVHTNNVNFQENIATFKFDRKKAIQ